jgi:hypothetical protein
MRITLIIILSFSLLSIFSQSIEESERDLKAVFTGKQDGSPMTMISELLAVDKFNSTAIELKLRLYHRLNQKDSIRNFFDNLIEANKNSHLPYLLRVKYAQYENLKDNKILEYLNTAFSIDSSNVQVNYYLTKTYYKLFHADQLSYWRRTDQSNFYARKTIYFINKTCSIDKHYCEKFKYPYIQLCNYLRDTAKIDIYDSYIDRSTYFPIALFLNLPSDWETNYMIDLIDILENRERNWYSKHLKAMQEPVIRNSTHKQMFRFTWLRTFDNPVVIRLENDNNKITLFWKVTDGKGGYDPGEIIINEKKELTEEKWKVIYDEINEINFYGLMPNQRTMGLDGAQWILEGNEFGKYHAIVRWNGMGISKVCLNLLRLTGLEIESIY